MASISSIDTLLEAALRRPLTDGEVAQMEQELRASDESLRRFMIRCQLESDLRLLLKSPPAIKIP